MDIAEEDVVGATFYAREELPRPARERAEAVRAELEAVAADGPLDELTVREWANRVPVDDPGTELLEVYPAFSAWADDAGTSLAPFFATRKCYSPAEGDMTDWLVVPAFALAIRVGGELSAVYPHSDGGETATVQDGIDALRAVEDEPREALLAGGEPV